MLLPGFTDLPPDVSPDGNPVAVYLVLPVQEEADLICAAIKPKSSVLELGCGAGRIARELVARGHRVVGVDQSTAMLQHVGAPVQPVLADIEALNLEERFDAVLLASYLINTADRDLRARFLATCHRHLAPDGVLVIQRVDPGITQVVGSSSWYGPVCVSLLAIAPRAHALEACLEYRLGPHTFEQTIVIEVLDDTALRTALAAAGLRFDHWLDGASTWAAVRAEK